MLNTRNVVAAAVILMFVSLIGAALSLFGTRAAAASASTVTAPALMDFADSSRFSRNCMFPSSGLACRRTAFSIGVSPWR